MVDEGLDTVHRPRAELTDTTGKSQECGETMLDSTQSILEQMRIQSYGDVPNGQQDPFTFSNFEMDSQPTLDHEDHDQLRRSEEAAITPTCIWTQYPCEADEMPPFHLPRGLFPGQDDMGVSDLLVMYRDTNLVDIGSVKGITLVHKSHRTRIQVQAPEHLICARAYMLQGGCCPACFLECQGWECPKCHSPMNQFRLPTFDAVSNGSIADIFHRYKSHSLQALEILSNSPKARRVAEAVP